MYTNSPDDYTGIEVTIVARNMQNSRAGISEEMSRIDDLDDNISKKHSQFTFHYIFFSDIAAKVPSSNIMSNVSYYKRSSFCAAYRRHDFWCFRRTRCGEEYLNVNMIITFI